MTAPLRASISFAEPGEFVAAVPYLLGFHPHESLVVVTLTGSEPAVLGATLRVDLPDPRHYQLVVDQLVAPAEQHEARAIAVVVLGGGRPDPPLELPHRDLVELIEKVMTDAGISLVHAVWADSVTEGTTWWCYDDPECTGQIPDPAASQLAAMNAVDGVVTFRSRDELAATVAPDPPEALRRRAELLDGASATGSPEDGLRLVRDLIDEGLSDAADLSDRQLIDVVTALRDGTVRDTCLAMALGSKAREAERLWTALTRALPDSARVESACLLAASAYLRGDGAMAGLAVERALDADPRHLLACLLRRALDLSLPPEQIRALIERRCRVEPE